MVNLGEFPQRRMRRLRRTKFLRDMVRESALSPADFIYPVFLLDGIRQKQAVASMPGIERPAAASVCGSLQVTEMERWFEISPFMNSF